jgi:hypothetical protein
MPSPRQQAITFGRYGNEQTGSAGVLEHGEHKIVTHWIPGRPCKLSNKSILHTRSIASEVEETVCKESDSLIVPMKLVITVEGRGGHIGRFECKTPSHWR